MSGRQLAEKLANPKVKISRSAKIGQDMSEESFFGAMGLLGNISHLFK